MNYDILVKKLIKNFKKKNFYGVDFYYDKELFHPMAYGKYLESFEILIKYNIYNVQTDLEIREIFQSNLETLENNINIFKNKKIGFGLNFRWKNFKKNESFLITNLIIYKALRDVSFLLKKKNLLNDLKFILLKWPKNKNNYFYAYLNQNTKPIFNVIAKYLQFLHETNISIKKKNSLKKFFIKKINKFPFPYYIQFNSKKKNNNSTYDLLHNLYIIESLIDVDDNLANLEKYESIISYFINFDQKNNIIFFSDISSVEKTIKQKIKKPRIWSIGVLIQVLTKLYKKKKFNYKTLENIVISLVKFINNEFKEHELYSSPRQCSHLLCGLSYFLKEKQNK